MKLGLPGIGDASILMEGNPMPTGSRVKRMSGPTRPKWLAWSCLAIMTVLACGVTLTSLRYYGALWHQWIGVDPRIRAVVEAHPVEALTHMLVAPVALLIGPLQFFPGLRARSLRFHRWSGRVYVATCVVAGVGGLLTAFYASGGPVAGFGFGLLAVVWTGTTLAAWRAAVGRNVLLHQLLMRFSYAMTFGAVTLRLQIPFGHALGFPTYSAFSVWLAYTAWLPNVIVVGLYSLWLEKLGNVPLSPGLRRVIAE